MVLEDAAKGLPALNSTADRMRGRGPTHQSPDQRPAWASKNPHYFADATGAPLILCGSHSWNTLQDWGIDGSVRPLDFDAFIDFLKAHGHNCTLLWYTELPRFHGLPTTDADPPDFTVRPHPWLRTGPGLATDGEPKFDLTKFNPEYFDRLRTRVHASEGRHLCRRLFVKGRVGLALSVSHRRLPVLGADIDNSTTAQVGLPPVQQSQECFALSTFGDREQRCFGLGQFLHRAIDIAIGL